ncbi:MAG: 3-phosphoshikimate 1-carboxyvinyltransferase, partial [Planctomycetota bacterium]
LARALDSFGGLEVESTPEGFRVSRSESPLEAPRAAMDMGGAGTPARFLLSFAAAAQGNSVITGNPRLRERPMDHLLDALGAMGIHYECFGKPGCLPVRIHGGTPGSTTWKVRGDVSSQFTSSLLLYASQQRQVQSIRIQVEGHIVSKPYVDMTLAMMNECGLPVKRVSDLELVVSPATPNSEKIHVEADASGMSYFLAAAALTGTTVKIRGVGCDSAQGDVGLAHAFEQMGCQLEMAEDSIQITGAPLSGITIDMETMPDVVLTLAVAASRASGSTRIHNIANLRVKECDRIHAAARELQRLGVHVDEGRDCLEVHPTGTLQPARIHTYDDHRVAMAFGVLGLVKDGIEIQDPECVAKSFPGFWNEMQRFRSHHQG